MKFDYILFMAPDQLDYRLRAVGWSQAELARRLGKAEVTFTRWRKAGVIPGYVESYLELATQLKAANEMLTQALEKTL